MKPTTLMSPAPQEFLRYIRKILVPVDFSPASRAAADYGRTLAEFCGAGVTLFHVAPPIEFEFSMAAPAKQKLLELAESRNQSLRHALDSFLAAGDGLDSVARELGSGDPAEEILRVAQEGNYDLIVMPTRGASVVRRWFLIGSVAAQVLSGADRPVLTGVEMPASAAGIRGGTIVCAVDLDSDPARLIQWAVELARLVQAELTVVHASPSLGEVSADFFDETWRTTLHSRLGNKIRDLLRQENGEAEVIVRAGSPHRVVSDVARELHADLVIVGRSAGNDLFGRLRANAYEIIRRCPCPVASV